MGWLHLAILSLSTTMLFLVATNLSRLMFDTLADRIVASLAFVGMQLGAISSVCSIFHQFKPGPFLSLQLTLVAGTWFLPRKKSPDFQSFRFDAIAAICAFAGVIFLATSFITQWLTPLNGHDELMYHASRVAYWLQHARIFPYLTHNDRQVQLPFGAELYFAWPLLLTKSETTARCVFWLGYPLCAFWVALVTNEATRDLRTSIIAALVAVSTPAVVHYSVGLKPELYTATFALGVAYCMLRLLNQRDFPRSMAVLLGIYLVLAINAKTTMLAIVPVVFLAFCLSQMRHMVLPFTAGILAGFATSGLGITAAYNLYNFASPLGSPAFTQMHQPTYSARQMYTHLARVPLALLDIPWLPSQPAREAVESLESQYQKILHADLPLALEQTAWPGPYKPLIPKWAATFSLPGLAIIPALIAAITLSLRRRNASLFFLSLLPAFALTGAVFFIRWMDDGPGRFWLPAFILSVPIIAFVASNLIKSRPIFMPLLLVLVVAFIVPSFIVESSGLRAAVAAHGAFVSNTPSADAFNTVASALPSNSHILLLADQDAPDYLLFHPAAGLDIQVFSYGKAPFNAARMRKLIDRNSITAVLIQNDTHINLHWDGLRDTRPALAWLQKQPDVYEARSFYSPLRLFLVGSHFSAADLANLPFFGWENSTGLRALEGPYPQWSLPMVRWGLAPATIIQSELAGAHLQMSLRCCGAVNGQTIAVYVNGGLIARHPLAKAHAIESFSVPLPPSTIRQEIQLQYDEKPLATTDPAMRVLFLRLRIENTP